MNSEQRTGNNEFIEQQIITAVRELLTERVNKMLGDMQFSIPLIEFGIYRGVSVVVPVIALSSCECSEKERIVRMDAYSLSITFNMPETVESEFFCYAYASAVRKAVEKDKTLSGLVNKVMIAGKKYTAPKTENCGQGWELVITLRITIEQ
jgi:hypothetical protein